MKCNIRHKLILGQFPPHKVDLQSFVPSTKLRQRFVKEDAIIKLHRSSRAHPSAIALRESKFAAWSALWTGLARTSSSPAGSCISRGKDTSFRLSPATGRGGTQRVGISVNGEGGVNSFRKGWGG
jgi:hypothetical protein